MKKRTNNRIERNPPTKRRSTLCAQQECTDSKHLIPVHSARAFSLVELMVVVLIMGMLATVVTVSVRDYLSKGKQTTAQTEISQIGSALELFHAEYGHYPSNEEGLAKLQERTPEHPTGILQGDLLDAWNRPYVYVQPGLHGPYDILSYGADGQEGGEGADADIVNWNLSGAGES